jgi:hypothetical protein
MSIKATQRLQELLAIRAATAAAHCSKPKPNKPPGA